MAVNNKVIWLRIGYGWGIIQDVFYCFPLLLPEHLARPIFGVDPTGNIAYINACRDHFPLMAAWTLLLIWADRKPVERREVMLFTAIIVALKSLITVFTNGFVWEIMWVARLGTLALFIFGYLYSRGAR